MLACKTDNAPLCSVTLVGKTLFEEDSIAFRRCQVSRIAMTGWRPLFGPSDRPARVGMHLPCHRFYFWLSGHGAVWIRLPHAVFFTTKLLKLFQKENIKIPRQINHSHSYFGVFFLHQRTLSLFPSFISFGLYVIVVRKEQDYRPDDLSQGPATVFPVAAEGSHPTSRSHRMHLFMFLGRDRKST